MPGERRAALAVDLDCSRCGGTGRVAVRAMVPGASRAGGGPSGVCAVAIERLCACVVPVAIDAPERREET